MGPRFPSPGSQRYYDLWINLSVDLQNDKYKNSRDYFTFYEKGLSYQLLQSPLIMVERRDSGIVY